ncbi:lipocalin family protein [Aquimarina celericrescens]|uniref:Lipocalin family protein n=1 Tax=Aquimarina celericrescens TaxID=1964542 RepID=A0ABW5AUT3_9FLAO|nr:lipocalin family protein [Aquimarina celericrescens]
MKKLGLLILLFTSILTSCGSDDDTPNGNEQNNSELIGKWVQISLSQNGETITLTECEKRSTIEFDVQSYTEISIAPVNTDCQVDFEDNGTWQVNGDQLTLTYIEEGEEVVETSSFKVVEDTLTLNYAEEGFTEERSFKKS